MNPLLFSPESSAGGAPDPAPRDFLRQLIDEDNRTGRFGGRVRTRFPPEPNGYLHIGHAKAICLNFGLAEEFGGQCYLRMDDTNPVKEEMEYIEAIIRDVTWLGVRWEGEVRYASDYFEQIYAWAEELVAKGLAYVCDLTPEQVRQHRGTLTEPGRDSPFRERSAAESLDLLRRMRAGEFPDGSRTLRARIDMKHPNLNMRDPVLYRILHEAHPHVGSKWCIYPMYDWAHGFEDSIEGITHSICTLEFENHRPLYDWFIDAVNRERGPDSRWGPPIPHPRQIEFNRLNVSYTLMSKRRLLQLVQEKHVRGWDDPRMPTIAGIRRRGVTPAAVRAFCKDVGVSKYDGVIDVARLDNAIREDLNRTALRVMAVLRPIRLVIENWGEGGDPERVDFLDAVNNPEDPAAGSRKVPFSRVLYIEQDDFRESPPPKYWRLFPGNEVRLRYAYFVRCTGVDKDPRTGEITEIRCTYDPATRGGDAPDGRKVKATIHWVSAAQALPIEARLYEHLFVRENPDDLDAADAAAGKDWRANLNPASLETIERAWVEPSVAGAPVGTRYQFERLGYFCIDEDSAPPAPGAAARRLVFNRTVTLRDAWAKIERRKG